MREGRWTLLEDGGVELEGRRLEEGEYELALVPRSGLEGIVVQALPSNDTVVALDVRTTPELEREGVARDVVRLIQMARREADRRVFRFSIPYLALLFAAMLVECLPA